MAGAASVRLLFPRAPISWRINRSLRATQLSLFVPASFVISSSKTHYSPQEIPQTIYFRGFRRDPRIPPAIYGTNGDSGGFSLACAIREDFAGLLDHDLEAFPGQRFAQRQSIVFRVRRSGCARDVIFSSLPG